MNNVLIDIIESPTASIVIPYKEEVGLKTKPVYVSKQRVYKELIDYFGQSAIFLRKKNKEIFG